MICICTLIKGTSIINASTSVLVLLSRSLPPSTATISSRLSAEVDLWRVDSRFRSSSCDLVLWRSKSESDVVRAIPAALVCTRLRILRGTVEKGLE